MVAERYRLKGCTICEVLWVSQHVVKMDWRFISNRRNICLPCHEILREIKGRGRTNKRWMVCVKDVMGKKGVNAEMAADSR